MVKLPDFPALGRAPGFDAGAGALPTAQPRFAPSLHEMRPGAIRKTYLELTEAFRPFGPAAGVALMYALAQDERDAAIVQLVAGAPAERTNGENPSRANQPATELDKLVDPRQFAEGSSAEGEFSAVSGVTQGGQHKIPSDPTPMPNSFRTSVNRADEAIPPEQRSAPLAISKLLRELPPVGTIIDWIDALSGHLTEHQQKQLVIDTLLQGLLPGSRLLGRAMRSPLRTPFGGEATPEAIARSLPAAAPVERVGVINMAADTLERARTSLRDMFTRFSKEAPTKPERIDLGEITPEGVARLNALLRNAGIDVDLTGYRHVVDAYAARHGFNRHGNAAAEARHGQLAVTADDWAKIPDILQSPDRIAVLGRTKRSGLQTIGYWKQVNGHVLYIEEVRTGQKTLTATTMMKFKAGRSGASGVPGRPDGPRAPRSTSETLTGMHNTVDES